VVHVLQSIRGEALTREEARRAAVLGWAIEWLQAFFLVADDVMDGSITRRGQPCWYKLPKVGMTAVNDAFLLQAHLFKLLKSHFGAEPALYAALLELFNEVTWQTELGQLLDLTSQPPPAVAPVDLDRFTLERYQSIVKYKTAYYSFYLPVAAAFLLAGGRLAEPATLAASERILVLMGQYFQVQDDVLDAFAPPEVLGKIGTDIQVRRWREGRWRTGIRGRSSPGMLHIEDQYMTRRAPPSPAAPGSSP
jgi:farnesyl diphosphate synthase